jgi:WD40 repeat protein
MIDRLIAELGKKLDLSAEELADVIWLTLIRQEENKSELPKPQKNVTEVKKKEPVTPPATSLPPITALDRPPTEPVAGIVSHQSSTTNTVLDRIPIKVANPPSLRNPLALARSLRPLMKQVPSGRVEGLDEQATAQQIAEAGIWQPIVKPFLEPWLEIVLVADESTSMLIWRQTVLEFRKLLRNYGAFRDVQLWGLHCEGERVCLRPGIGFDALQQAARQPEELIDPSGRRLILLISDCVAPYWQEDLLIKTLKLWSQQSPMAIAQVLPEWLWVRTAIRGYESVQLAGLEPGVSNSQLKVDWSEVWQSVTDPQSGVCLPIVPLEPDSVLTWSKMVMGQSDAPGYWLKSFPTEIDLPTGSSLSPAQLLERFQVISSPMAQRLMGLLAASLVITLPVIRLIQETLLPKSQQMHVAEVLLGGLLEPIIPPQLGTNPDEVEYRFIDEAIRELLLKETPVPDTVKVLSSYVERQFDKSLDEFVAELQLWSQGEDVALVNKARSFATVTAAVLKRKGGRYREFVEQVERRSQSYTSEEVTSSENIIGQDRPEELLAPSWICESSFVAHDDKITCICFSSDGQLLASSSDDHSIRLWDSQQHQISHSEVPTCLAIEIDFSPDSKMIVSGNSDHTLQLWDLDGNPVGSPFQGHLDYVTSVAFSPYGRTIVSGGGSADRTLRLWDLQGSPIGLSFQGHRGAVTSVAFSPDGRTIVSGSADRTLRLWDLQGNPIGSPFEGHTDRIYSVAISQDGKTIVSGSADRTLRLWDLQGNPIGSPFEGHTDRIYSVAISPDGRTIISGSRDHTIRVWNQNGDLLSELQGHTAGVNTVTFSPDGQFIASCSSDRSIKIWKSQNAEPVAVTLFYDEPGGQVSLESPFYITRSPIEERCYQAIVKPGALIRIKAPNQMGKTSLMSRILDHASEEGAIVVSLNFQLADRSVFTDLDRFLRWFCASVSRELQLPNQVEDHWDEILSSNDNCTDYFYKYILKEIDKPLVLGLDEMDLIFQYKEIAVDFLGLLRGWNAKGKIGKIWPNLRLVFAYTKEGYLLEDTYSSPFNVGLLIELKQLTQSQVMDMVNRYGLKWSETELKKLMDTIGGHPYLVHVALHQIAKEGMSLDQILQFAPTEDGMYGEHLRRHLLNLEKDEKLLAAMKQIIAVDQPVSIDTKEAFKLVDMGLVQRQDNKVLLTGDLYRRYFKEQLINSGQSNIDAELKVATAISEIPTRTSLWQERSTQIYSLCTSALWSLPLDALVIPVGLQGGLGSFAEAAQELLEIRSNWLTQMIDDKMAANNLKRIKPDQPLLVQIPFETNNQISSLVGFTSERFIICATSESVNERNSNNTSIAYEVVVRLAIQQGLKRIVMPLIGTGRNRLPVDKVAEGMLRAIDNVLKSHRSTSLEEITIIDRDADKIETIDRIAHQLKPKAAEVSPEVQTILFLEVVNSMNSMNSLRLDREFQEIKERLQITKNRDLFNLEQRFVVYPDDIQRAIQYVNPQIIHFCGQGTDETGLVFEDANGNTKPFDGNALAELFSLFADQVQCVLLSGCYAEVQAQAITQHIPYVIGIKKEIDDRATINFAVSFYDALGSDCSIEFAFGMGCAAIQTEGIAEHLTPVLISKNSADEMKVPSPNSPTPIEIFISYAYKDKALRDKLANHLNSIERQGVITLHDRNISAGEEWKKAIDSHLESANIILLLISPDFLASDYCYNIEMKRSLERHENNEATVIPIILRASDWNRSPIGKLAALPKDGRAITSWQNEDEAFTDVVIGLRRVIDSCRAKFLQKPLLSKNYVDRSEIQNLESNDNQAFGHMKGGTAIGKIVGNVIHNYYYREEVNTAIDDAAESVATDRLPCPYRGLFHFGPGDAEYFFGRERFVEELVRATQTRNFISLLGASGSGKSSVVLAGLVPKLQQVGHWQFTHFRPGSDPYSALAQALVPLYTTNLDATEKIAQARKLAGYFRTGEVLLTDVFAKIQQNYPTDRVLLIADQFEELYTLCTDETIRQNFLDLLLAGISAPANRGSFAPVLITTMRADFLGQALSYRPFANILQNADLTLGPMNRAELTEAIEKPAQKLGVTFEAGLVQRILGDVNEEPVNLSLLEFTLTELWQQRSGKQLTHAVYENIGGVKGALARYSDREQPKITSPHPIPHNLPRSGAIKFVGHAEKLEQIRRQLQQNDRLAITGMGGIGKSELALQYAIAQLQQGKYPAGICWLRARDREIAIDIVNFAQVHLGLELPEQLEIDAQVAFCWQHWPQGEALIVLDDVTDYQAIEPYLPPADSRFKLLITTRLDLGRSIQRIAIKELDENSAISLLESFVGGARIRFQLIDVQVLCQWVGYLPLALELLGRFLARKPDLSIRKLLNVLKEKQLDAKALVETESSMTGQLGVAAALELSWQELNESERELAYVLGLVEVSPIPWSLVESYLPEMDSEDLEDTRDNGLIARSLIERVSDGTYHINPIVQQYFRIKLGEKRDREQASN